MARLSDTVFKVRSKNAGPFWVTIDIFCGDAETFEKVSKGLTTGAVARLFDQPTQEVKRFDVKFEERLHGISHWNVDLRSKWKFIVRTIRYSVELKKGLKYGNY